MFDQPLSNIANTNILGSIVVVLAITIGVLAKVILNLQEKRILDLKTTLSQVSDPLKTIKETVLTISNLISSDGSADGIKKLSEKIDEIDRKIDDIGYRRRK